MTAVTPTEVSYTDIPNVLGYGTSSRRVMVFVRATTDASSNTLALTTYIPNIADIEGVMFQTIDGAVAATSITWSTVTITFAGHTGSGVTEIGLICTLT